MRDRTDAQWAILQPLLPPRKRTGRPRADARRTLNAILSVLRTGCASRGRLLGRFAWLGHQRRLLVRHEAKSESFHAFSTLACIRLALMASV